MSLRRVIALWIVVMVLTVPVLAGVHTLRLGDGRLISGQLVRASAESIWFRPSGDTTVVQFPLTDVVSIRFSSGSTTPAAEREPVTAEVGTRLRVALQGPLSTGSSNAGDTFFGTLVSEMSVAGNTLAPAGQEVKGRVRKVVRPPAKGQRAVLELVLTSVTVGELPVPIITDHFGIETDGAGGVRTNGAAGIEGVSLLMLTDTKDLNLKPGTVLVFHLAQPMIVR